MNTQNNGTMKTKYRIVKDKFTYKTYMYFIEEYYPPYFFGLCGGYWKRLTEMVFTMVGDEEDDRVFETVEEAEEFLKWIESEKTIIKEIVII